MNAHYRCRVLSPRCSGEHTDDESGHNAGGVSERGAPEEVPSAAAIHVAPCWEEVLIGSPGPGSTEKLGHHPLIEVGRDRCVIEHSLHTEAVAGGDGDDGELGGSQCRLLLSGAV